VIIKCERRTQVQVVQGVCQDPDCTHRCWYGRSREPYPDDRLQKLTFVRLAASLFCPRSFDEGWKRAEEWFAGGDPCQDATDDCPHICPCLVRRPVAGQPCQPP
jgi:hypothetical protein